MSGGVFVPGKVILAGEHAVVYGKMALSASINKGVRARVVKRGVKNEVVRKAIEVAGGEPQIEVEIESELPVGSGLGSSAAVAAATIGAVRAHLNRPIDKDELFELTMECERIAHGNPSGIDPATVVYGGLIAFTKGQPFERLKIRKPIKLLLIETGKPSESTKEMVEMVASKTDKDAIINEIGKLTERVRGKLVKGEEIGEDLDQNGRLLEELGVVSEKAKSLSDELRRMGGKVKITGAGGVKTGSGMMMVAGRDLLKIKAWLDNRQIRNFEITVGTE